MSRAGLGPLTGIDRVELAYISNFLDQPVPLFALCRTTLGFVLVDPLGVEELHARLTGAVRWGKPDLIGRMTQRHNRPRASAESDLRRLAVGRARPPGLVWLLRNHLPPSFSYVNVGHFDLSAQVFEAIHGAEGRATVLVHDTIPLDCPGFAAPGLPEAFARRMSNVAHGADLVICNSNVTMRDAARHFGLMNRIPPMIVSHLGVEVAQPDPAALPAGLDLSRPYFVTIGTIEPRKNHVLLLNIWEEMAANPPPGGVPDLYIVGRRGWNNADVFARLDAGLPHVHELGPLPDGAAAALMKGSLGLLFPSFVEGYGLPPVEAAALGVPVLCGDLAIYRETLDDYPVYADVNDSYLWRRKIDAMVAQAGRAEGTSSGTGQAAPRLQTWADHFKPVLRLA